MRPISNLVRQPNIYAPSCFKPCLIEPVCNKISLYWIETVQSGFNAISFRVQFRGQTMWFVPQYITRPMPGAGGHWNAWNAWLAWKGEGAKTDKPQDMLRQPPYTELCVSSSCDFSECPLGQNQSHTGHDWSRTTCFDRQPPLSCHFNGLFVEYLRRLDYAQITR